MGCNCNNENDYVNLSTGNINSNIILDNVDNFSNSYGNCDCNPRIYPEQPLLKFVASKKPCANLAAAKEMIENKRPALVLGQPAVVQYYDASGNIRLLFCIGAARGEKCLMFQITDEGGAVPSGLLERLERLEEQMTEVYADISALVAKDNQQDVSINLALMDSSAAKQIAVDVSAKVSNYDNSINIAINTAESAKTTATDVSARVGTFDSRITEAQTDASIAKQDASIAKQIAVDVSARVGTFDSRITEAQTDASIAKRTAEDVSANVSKYDTSINIAITYATDAKTTATDVSAKVSNYDTSINLANTNANAAKTIAVDASNKMSDDNIQEVVQRLLDLGYITVSDASYAEDSSTANYATDASTANFATNADRASFATYATSCQEANHATWADRVGSAQDASKAEGMVWYDVEE